MYDALEHHFNNMDIKIIKKKKLQHAAALQLLL